jgi:hypothetical protein
MTCPAFTRFNSVADNIDTLRYAMSADPGADRRTSYVRVLNRLQSWRLVDEGDVQFAFAGVDDRLASADLVAHFLDQEVLHSCNVYAADEQQAISINAAHGLALIASTGASVADVVTHLLVVVLFARKPEYGGGSRADMLGVVWLAPPNAWTALDYAEALWHETVHQALFLEEMVHGLYAAPVGQMADGPALVISAIRRARRPYDLAFHAACVASGLVHLNFSLGRTSRCSWLLDGLYRTLPGLHAKSAYLSSNGRAILSDLVECTAAQAELLGRNVERLSRLAIMP